MDLFGPGELLPDPLGPKAGPHSPGTVVRGFSRRSSGAIPNMLLGVGDFPDTLGPQKRESCIGMPKSCIVSSGAIVYTIVGEKGGVMGQVHYIFLQ